MILYALTIFVSAFLLFQIEPIIGKIILPWFGGTAAVWTTCLLFFQVVLLLGYLYAHWSIQYLRARQQAYLHLALLGASAALVLMLHITPGAGLKPQGNDDPTLRILIVLACTVGLPFFLLSTTGPLLQAWYARHAVSDRLQHSDAGDAEGDRPQAFPYRLYALSNAGSMLALLGYPVLVEPNLTLHQQAFEWTAGYVVFVLLCGAVAWRLAAMAQGAVADAPAEAASPPAGEEVDPAAAARPAAALHLFWLLLAALPSIMLLAVTNHLSQNVAAIPFLWVLPLSLYLLSFIVCFGGREWRWQTAFLPIPALVIAGMTYGLIEGGSHPSLKMLIPLYALGLFVCCILCHGELARLKPHPRYLTSFYLMVSIGGAVGGVFVGLLAPRLFNDYYELPISIAGCALLALFVLYRDARKPWWNGSWTALAVMTMWLLWYMVDGVRQVNAGYRFSGRNFYGVLHVSESGDPATGDAVRSLTHGTTLHGEQFLKPSRQMTPTTYYGPVSGVGLAVREAQRSGPERVGIIGLGTGTIASYGRIGDYYRFYDINPLVLRLSGPHQGAEFTFLRNSHARVDIALGDARLSLEREPDQNFDVLAVDAFSSDAIPVHLLTREAFELYFRHLKPGGVLAVHVSNRYLNLQPVVQDLAQALGKAAMLVSSDDEEEEHITAAEWILVTARRSFFKKSLLKGQCEPIAVKRHPRLWTDDYSNLYQILK